MDQELISHISEFGLTRQEATIYLHLLENGVKSGYEIAKETGISRSNVYNAISSLQDKGACYLMEGASNRYIGVSFNEFCENKVRNMREIQKEIIDILKPIPVKEDGYVTIEGCKNIRDKMITMIHTTQKRMYLSGSYQFVLQWMDDILLIIKRGCKVVFITDVNALKNSLENYPDDKQVYLSKIVLYDSGNKEKQFHMITDSEYAITGEYSGNSNDTALYTGQKNFVTVLKEALKNEIQLIEIRKSIPEHKGEKSE